MRVGGGGEAQVDVGSGAGQASEGLRQTSTQQVVEM